MHGAGARAAPDGSARAAHRDAAAPLASEHGGGVTERVATLLLSLHRGIIRRPAVCTCRPPVRLDLCVGECGGLSLSVRVRPPPARIFSDSLQGPARARTRERKKVSSWRLWRVRALPLALRDRSVGKFSIGSWLRRRAPVPASTVPCLNFLARWPLAWRSRIGASLRSDHRNMANFGVFAVWRWVASPHRIGQVEQNHAIKINTDLE